MGRKWTLKGQKARSRSRADDARTLRERERLTAVPAAACST